MKTKRRGGVAVWLAGAALLAATAGAREARPEPDGLCQQLFDEYVVRRGKINSPTRRAAIHILAERGWGSGFWREVLAELRRDDPQTELDCVHLLGLMLETDAKARDAIAREKETGVGGQWAASVELPPEVTEELLARARKVEPMRVDAYAVALVRAGVPEAGALFRAILVGELGDAHAPSQAFHAAVGLAQLGDPEGFRWLFAHGNDPSPSVGNAWPEPDLPTNLDTCCREALRDLSARSELRTLRELEEWWKEQNETPPLRPRVRLADH